MTSDTDYIKQRLNIIYKTTFLKAKDYEKMLFDIVVHFYTEPHRKYHNLSHLVYCFRQFDNYIIDFYGSTNADKFINISVIQLAILFHDLIYDTHGEKNEESSAKLAKALIWGGTPSYGVLDIEVAGAILATKHFDYNSVLTEEDKIVLDIDLSILGADKEKFNEYEDNIRKEYSWVDDITFNQERLKVILKLLNKNKIYNTSYFYNKLEKKAVENLNNSRIKLRKLLGYNEYT